MAVVLTLSAQAFHGQVQTQCGELPGGVSSDWGQRRKLISICSLAVLSCHHCNTVTVSKLHHQFTGVTQWNHCTFAAIDLLWHINDTWPLLMSIRTIMQVTMNLSHPLTIKIYWCDAAPATVFQNITFTAICLLMICCNHCNCPPKYLSVKPSFDVFGSMNVKCYKTCFIPVDFFVGFCCVFIVFFTVGDFEKGVVAVGSHCISLICY